MLCACIDIGSNTTRVLVVEAADGRIVEVLQRRAFTRIGRGLAPGAAIPAARIQEVARVVGEQADIATGLGARALRVVGTAAIREAANGVALCTAIREQAGVEVEILDGEEEARLAFLGATRTLARAPSGRIGVADVGGGSSEIAIGTMAAGVQWSASFALGSGRLTDAYVHSDPPAASELAAIGDHVTRAFAGLEPPTASSAVAVGGSATSLRRLVGAMAGPEALARAVEVLAANPCDAVAQRLGLDPIRVRLLPAGILILAAIGRLLDQPLEMGAGGLREGVCLELSRGG